MSSNDTRSGDHTRAEPHAWLVLATFSAIALCVGFAGAEESRTTGRAACSADKSLSQQSVGSSVSTAETAEAEPSAAAVVEQWKTLNNEECDALTKRHLRAIALAIHAYADKHGSALPPAIVPNPNLTPEKRLSGLVLLLPYFGTPPDYLAEPDNHAFWLKYRIDPEQGEAARKLYESIDLSKAWDDPVNLKAARTTVPAFLAPGGDPARDGRGFAVSHFAMVRGYGGHDDGAFPEK